MNVCVWLGGSSTVLFFFAFPSVHNSNSKWLELAFVHHDAAHEDCCHLLTIWNMFGAFLCRIPADIVLTRGTLCLHSTSHLIQRL